MGIRPNSGDGVERNYVIDGRHDAEGLVSDAEHTGQEAGKAFAQISAQADSANTSASELSKRVAALEKRTGSTNGLITRLEKLETGAVAKDYVDEAVKTSAVLTTGTKTGSWAPWNKTTCPPWLAIGTSSLNIPDGRWRIEVLKGQVVVYENGALKDRAPAGWDGVVIGSSQVYDGTGNATLIVTKLY